MGTLSITLDSIHFVRPNVHRREGWWAGWWNLSPKWTHDLSTKWAPLTYFVQPGPGPGPGPLQCGSGSIIRIHLGISHFKFRFGWFQQPFHWWSRGSLQKHNTNVGGSFNLSTVGPTYTRLNHRKTDTTAVQRESTVDSLTWECVSIYISSFNFN